MRMQELLQRRAALCDQQETMLKTAHNEKRNLSVDEKSTFDNIDKGIADLEEQIEREKKFQDRMSDMESLKEFNLNGDINNKKEKNVEFSNFGEYLSAVAKAGAPYGRFAGAGVVDQRLVDIKNATGHSANVPSDGGFLVSATRSNEIMKKTYETGVIAADCASFEIGEYSDSLEVPYLDEASRAAGSRWGGLRAYREGETDDATATKTKLGLWECRVSDMKARVYVTERLLNDAPALESLIMEMLPQEFAFKLDDEILNGQGGLQCQGIIGDPATVSVTKESGQAAATITPENIIKMYTRAWGKGRQNSAWYINQDIEQQLYTMAFNIGTGGVPVFMPANGISGQPYNTLFGRPIKPVEQCATLGTVGDIIFANFGEYALVKKGGIKSASSMHVRFLYDEMVFKFNWRVNGKPKWKNALTPYKGTNTLSPFVTLATRS